MAQKVLLLQMKFGGQAPIILGKKHGVSGTLNWMDKLIFTIL